LTNLAGISNIVSLTPMKRREVGFDVLLFFLGKIVFETLKPSIECALFDLKVLILFLVIARVITAGMKMSFAPGSPS